MIKKNKERICIECGKRIPENRSQRAITCSKKCSNKRTTTSYLLRKGRNNEN